MIEAKLMRSDGILIVAPTGVLQRTDFERLRLLVDPYIEEHGILRGLLIDAESFPGWEDFGGLIAHLNFARNHEASIARVAAVTDSPVLALLPVLANHFSAAEVRHFEYRDRDRALAWLHGESGEPAGEHGDGAL
jgi:hypothetical protein